MRLLTVLAAALLGAAMLRPLVSAKPLAVFDEEEDKVSLRKAERELKDLQRRIMRKEIPPIEFEFNSAKLRPYSKTTLDLVADLMFRHPSLKLMIFGHTCNIGSEQYNLWLSQKRAEAVKNYLARVGVLGEYVKAKGFGESRPIASNDTEEGRKKNRRVEFVLTTRWWHSIF